MNSRTAGFDATMERAQGGGVLTLRGELDISSVPRAEVELERAEDELAEGDPLIVDLRGLDFMDSTGLRFILTASQRARESGRRFAVVRGPEAVDRVFRVTRVDSMLEMVDDPAAALAR